MVEQYIPLTRRFTDQTALRQITGERTPYTFIVKPQNTLR